MTLYKIPLNVNVLGFIFSNVTDLHTAWKMSKYGVLSGPYFPVFGPEITPDLDTFHAVSSSNFVKK